MCVSVWDGRARADPINPQNMVAGTTGPPVVKTVCSKSY